MALARRLAADWTQTQAVMRDSSGIVSRRSCWHQEMNLRKKAWERGLPEKLCGQRQEASVDLLRLERFCSLSAK